MLSKCSTSTGTARAARQDFDKIKKVQLSELKAGAKDIVKMAILFY